MNVANKYNQNIEVCELRWKTDICVIYFYFFNSAFIIDCYYDSTEAWELNRSKDEAQRSERGLWKRKEEEEGGGWRRRRRWRDHRAPPEGVWGGEDGGRGRITRVEWGHADFVLFYGSCHITPVSSFGAHSSLYPAGTTDCTTDNDWVSVRPS